MKALGIGILGIGAYIPPKIRRNTDWSPEVVAGFTAKSEHDLGVASASAVAQLRATESGRIALDEMAKWKDDPFHGARERRVVEPGTRSSDLEVAAAREALKNASLKASDIDLLMVYSIVPDLPAPGNAGLVHQRLELPAHSPAIDVGGACGSFLLQMRLAAPAIQSGHAKYAMLVQSSMQSVLADYRDPVSTTFGDAATAVILGPVAKERGILGCATSMDGGYYKAAAIAPADDQPWYEAQSRIQLRSLDPSRTKGLIFKIGDMAKESMDRALGEAALAPKDVDFFTSHQTIAAFSAICRRAAGLDHARTMDTFPMIGSVAAATLPFNLHMAQRDGLLKDGDVAAVFTTGAGFHWSSMVLRWGG
jgi:3-oxoacyl-[acyl-carrier-protein] synthase-3